MNRTFQINRVLVLFLVLFFLVSCSSAPEALPTSTPADVEQDPYHYIAKTTGQETIVSGSEFQVTTDNCGSSVSANETLSRSREFTVEFNVNLIILESLEIKADALVAGAKVKAAVEQSFGVQVGATEAIEALRDIETPADSISVVTLQWEELWDIGVVSINENSKALGEVPFRIMSTMRLAQIGIQETPCETADESAIETSSAIFTLSDAKTEDFYTLKDASFVLRPNGELAIEGSYARGTYVNQALPTNFQATIQFRIEHPDDEFILGLSDGITMRPNYHLVMGSSRTGFKQQLDFDVTDQWDIHVDTTDLESCLIKPNMPYEVVFVRKNGIVDISINDECTFSFNGQEVENIDEFDFLYLTGAKNQQIIIESLIVESLE